METLSLSCSVLTALADGIDQAKFRVPRVLAKTGEMDKLIRPALHVHCVWAFGFAYDLSVADADVPKSTCTSFEALARMLNTVYDRCGGKLPLGFHLQQDNTWQYCRNSKVIKFATALVAKGIFRWVSLGYLVVGHTHDLVDQSFGQLTVKLSFEEFDDANECVAKLDRIVNELNIDASSRGVARAYKLDQVPDWEEWWDPAGVKFSKMTGHMAPHLMRICLREDLGLRGLPCDVNACVVEVHSAEEVARKIVLISVRVWGWWW